MNTEYYNDCFIDAMKFASDIAAKATDQRIHKYLLEIVECGARKCKLNMCYAVDFYTDLNALYTELFWEDVESSEDYTVA